MAVLYTVSVRKFDRAIAGAKVPEREVDMKKQIIAITALLTALFILLSALTGCAKHKPAEPEAMR